MSGFAVRGWCPSALRPMAAADGLVVRIRPPFCRITGAQTRALTEAAERFGRGWIELTSRANLQIRGVAEAQHLALLDHLAAVDLIDPDPRQEAARAVMVTPFHEGGDDTLALAAKVQDVLQTAPPLPSKFGIAVDCSAGPVLGQAAADIRLERTATGTLILRPDGAAQGVAVTAESLPEKLGALIAWFAASGIREGRGRMAAHLATGATLPPDLAGDLAPAPARPIAVGPIAQGALAGFAFGQIATQDLLRLAEAKDEIRITPWRMVYLPKLTAPPEGTEAITGAQDPLLRIHACTGAPDCPQAEGATRGLARALAPHLPPGATLHVAGCAKGCTHPGPADFVLTATAEGFALARAARAGDRPIRSGLRPETLLDDPSLLLSEATDAP